jgi:hypothetical protein
LHVYQHLVLICEHFICSKPNDQAGDRDGKDLLELLRTGHSSHCGWTNNFCSEELLTFPAKSSEIFIEEFLLRVRTILLSITEFARDACETAADRQEIEDVQRSSSSHEAESCSSHVQKVTSSRLQVLIGADVLNSASDLASWLLRDLPDGNVIELPLLAASSPACRSRIAATVEIISALLSRCTGGNTVLTTGDASGILNTILSPNGGNTSNVIGILGGEHHQVSEDEITARIAVKVSFLLAICGWNPVHSTGTSADSSVGAKAATSSSPSPTAVSTVASSSLCSFRCEWCGRSFPLSYLLSNPTDPLFQHRAFCLWAHSSGVSGVDSQLSTLPGWQQCASSVYECSSNQQPEVQDILHDTSSSTSSRRESASGDAESAPGSSSKRIARKDATCGDAEQAYKKIKSVMDSAALPRLSMNGRLSI